MPDAFQLKYYARGVGNVQVGWDGCERGWSRRSSNSSRMVALTADELAEVGEEALAMEDRATAYGRLGPARPIRERRRRPPVVVSLRQVGWLASRPGPTLLERRGPA